MDSRQHQQCAYNDNIEQLRQTEYPSLKGTTYLDHAGTTLYPASLINAYSNDLKSNLYGNPHSASPASDRSTQRVEQARLSVLAYFNADPNHFDVVFTANATAAIKLVADCFRDQGFWYGYHRDVHSSVVGVRQVAKLGSHCFASDEDIEKWINVRKKMASSPESLTLFAYPAQSNMTGYRPPLSWSSKIRESSFDDMGIQQTFVLLDAASYLTTGRLDLRDHKGAPDFIALSFYKIFGFPDLGALIVRKSARGVLEGRRYFGGGTVDQVTVIDADFHAIKTETIHDFLEDGTLPFHNIVALEHAITIHKKLFGSAQAISNHTSHLVASLYQNLSSLEHFNGVSVLQIHKDPSSRYGDPCTQGPIFAFSVLRSDGTHIGKSHFERLAIEAGFQLRTGGVCNPGGTATALDLNHWELRRNFTEGARCGGDIDVLGGKPTGIIRISLGPMSTMGDVKRFVEFIKHFFLQSSISNPNPAQQTQVHNKEEGSEYITPIEKCPSIHLIDPTTRNSHRVWDSQWLIVEKRGDTWKPLQSNAKLKALSCSIDPDLGILRIAQGDGPDLPISLWGRPQQQVCTAQTYAKPFDVYADPHAAQWLSQTLGLSCTLARYRGQDAHTLPEARICVIPTCRKEFKTKDDLWDHYKFHANSFLDLHSFGVISPEAERENVRSPEPTRPSTQPKRSRYSWTRPHSHTTYSVIEMPSSPSTTRSDLNEKTHLIDGRWQKRREKITLKNRIRILFAKSLGKCNTLA